MVSDRPTTPPLHAASPGRSIDSLYLVEQLVGYLGQAKTHLQHVFTAAAINVTRLLAWLDDVPFSTTRTSRFAALTP